jgi:hypothetical protein
MKHSLKMDVMETMTASLIGCVVPSKMAYFINLKSRTSMFDKAEW